jgi:hypothetical protein
MEMTALTYSAEVLDKAHELLARGGLRPDEEFANIWWITSLNTPGALYRVQSDFNPEKRSLSWITCTCPHGLIVGAGQTHCYHAAAVLITLREAQGKSGSQP